VKTTKHRKKKQKFSLLDQFPCEDAWLEKGQPFLTIVLVLASVFVVDSLNTDNSVGFSLIDEDFCGNNICDKYEDAYSCSEDCEPSCGDDLITHDEECEVNFHCDVGYNCNGCSCVR
jgi:hypothetical protein